LARERRFKNVKCPKDVDIDVFEGMLSTIPRGFVFTGSSRWLWWRNFTFVATGFPTKESGMKRGDIFETAVVCKWRLPWSKK